MVDFSDRFRRPLTPKEMEALGDMHDVIKESHFSRRLYSMRDPEGAAFLKEAGEHGQISFTMVHDAYLHPLLRAAVLACINKIEPGTFTEFNRDEDCQYTSPAMEAAVFLYNREVEIRLREFTSLDKSKIRELYPDLPERDMDVHTDLIAKYFAEGKISLSSALDALCSPTESKMVLKKLK